MRSIGLISRPIEIGLRLTGIWPNTLRESFLRIVWILLMGTSQIFQYGYVVTHFNGNELADLIESMSTSLPYSLLFMKLIIFWLNRRLLGELFTKMSSDWVESANNENTLNFMKRKAELSDRLSKVVLTIYVLAVVLYGTTGIEFLRRSGNDEIKPESRTLLIRMAFPFESENSPIFECILFVQFLQLLAVASTIGMLDGLMITLILHVGGQIDIMGDILRQVSSGSENTSLPRFTRQTLIWKHHRIIKFSNLVEQLFTNIALLQFLSNTLIMCFIGFIIISSLGSEDQFKILVRSTFFYVAITSEAFIFCFSGEYLSSKSRNICQAAYNCPWYRLDPHDSRIILLVMLRAQKQLTLSAGKFTQLSLEAFADIIKASASYVSVLNAIY